VSAAAAGDPIASFHPDVALGVAVASAAGEQICGDAWVGAAGRDGVLIAAIDGLGHGAAASTASQRAADVLRAHVDDPLPRLVSACHAALADTRGAALTVARIDVRAHTLTWLGIGNVAGVLVPAAAGTPAPAALLLSGVVGDQLPQLVPVTLPLVPGDTILLATDGVEGTVADELRRVRGSLGPLADGLLRRHRRDLRDDALVLLARFSPASIVT
jgi:hypothetical protein